MSVAEAITRARPLAWAAALVVLVCARADAQVVILQGAPAGATVELTFNSGTVVPAKADAAGSTTLAVPTNNAESNVQVHVDSCGTLVRIIVVEVGRQADPASAGCSRSTMWGSYIMRPVTTFVVDLTGSTATLHLRQGPAPAEWLGRSGRSSGGGSREWGQPMKGLT